MMERKLVTIRRIDQVWKHPDPEVTRIEMIQVGGWQLISGIGNFQPGDLCVFHEIDSFLPISHPAYADLAKTAIKWTDPTGIEREGHRLKTIKLRKEWSQGYALRLELFPELEEKNADGLTLIQQLEEIGGLEDYDFADLLGVVKWEKIIPMGGASKGSFPGFIPKTDEERIQNLFGKFGNRGEMQIREYLDGEGKTIRVERPYDYCRDDDWEVTIKLDGSSMTVFRRDEEFGVCSRNNDLVEVQEGNAFWSVAHCLRLRDRLNALGRNLALQGELVGPGIQGNTDKRANLDFYVFNIVDINTHKKLSRTERLEVLEHLNAFDTRNSIKMVPFVEIRKFDFATVQEALAYAEGPSLNPQVKREGVVFKSLQNPDISFKIISNSYLVKHDA